MSFKVGDRVRVISTFGGVNYAGKTGTVISADHDTYNIGVDFDEDIHGHDCDGLARQGHGRWGWNTELERLTKEPRFKVGDRVKVKPEHSFKGKTATVRAVKWSVGCEFDEDIGGHNLDGNAKDGHGWWIDDDYLELIETAPQCETVRVTLDLPPAFTYVARDMDGSLFAYADKPKRDVGGTQWYGEQFKKINDSLCPDLKWTDEPYWVKR